MYSVDKQFLDRKWAQSYVLKTDIKFGHIYTIIKTSHRFNLLELELHQEDNQKNM